MKAGTKAVPAFSLYRRKRFSWDEEKGFGVHKLVCAESVAIADYRISSFKVTLSSATSCACA